MPLPEENSSPDWMLLLTMHLHCHESEPKGASNPELSHYSTRYPTLCCQDPEITVTIALGRKGTKKKQNFFQPQLFRRSKTIQNRRFRPFSRSGMPLARSLAKCFKASPPRSGSCIAFFTPRCCSLRSAAGWRNVSAALGASPEALGKTAVAAGRCSQQGKSLTGIVLY